MCVERARNLFLRPVVVVKDSAVCGWLGTRAPRWKGAKKMLGRSCRQNQQSQPAVKRAQRRGRRVWWRAALHSDAIVLDGRGMDRQSRRFGYTVYDRITAQTFTASEQACLDYARAVIARRALARAVGSA